MGWSIRFGSSSFTEEPQSVFFPIIPISSIFDIILLVLESYSTGFIGHCSTFFTFAHMCPLKSKTLFSPFNSFFFLPTKRMNRNVIRHTPCCLISLWVFRGFHLSTDLISLVSSASPFFLYKIFPNVHFERIYLYIPESETIECLPTLLVQSQVSMPARKYAV